MALWYDGTEYIKLKLVGEDFNEIHFRMKPTTQICRLKKSYSKKVGVPETSLRFVFKGRRINSDETPKTLEMKQEEVIEVYKEQTGCDPNKVRDEVYKDETGCDPNKVRDEVYKDETGCDPNKVGDEVYKDETGCDPNKVGDKVYKDETGCDPNKVRGEVRDRYIKGIVETNEKMEDLRKTIEVSTEMKDKELEDLKNRQDFEKQTLDGKLAKDKMELEKEMANIKKRITENEAMWDREKEKMSVRHKEENEAVREKFADEQNQKALENLMKANSQLTDDLKKLDIDPNVAKKVDDATDILECPICMDMMSPPTKIWMCSRSHCVCEKCKGLLPRNMCPTCRTNKVNIRALTVENFATALFK